MEIDFKIKKAYIERVKQKGKNPLLTKLAREFLKQGEKFPVLPSAKNIRLGLAEEKDFLVIEKMVKLAYNKRYCPETGAKLSAFQETTQSPHTKTLVAKVVAGKQTLILGTCRLVEAQLELFSFFKFTDGQTWDLYLKNRPAYEMERLAYHPLFEWANYRDLQHQITKDMMVVAKSLIKQPNYWLGCTMRANVKKFIEKSGIEVAPIPNLVFYKNSYTDFLVDLFPSYFQDFYAYQIR